MILLLSSCLNPLINSDMGNNMIKIIRMLSKDKYALGCSLVSIVIFLYYLSINFKINYHDENGYVSISRSILTEGLFAIYEPWRTYLYPLIISFISIFTNGDIQLIKILMSIFQYIFYFYTVYLLGIKMYEFFKSQTIYYGILFFGLLNPYLIQATTLFLTDLLAICCVLLALINVVFGDFSKSRTYFLIFIFAYAGAMIRPSAVVFIPIIVLLIIIRKFIIKDVHTLKSIIASVSSLIIFFPQLHNNVKQFNDWTPLLHGDLYEFQSNLAAFNLKYGTVVIPNETPQLFFPSPHAVEGSTIGIFDLLLTDFPAFLTAYFSHLFGVLDWGYIETYINDYYPVSRIIGSLLLYLFWIVAFYGGYRFIKDKTGVSERFLAVSFIGSFVLYWGFIGTTIIESRFGYPLYMLLLPFAGWGIQYFSDYWKNRSISKSIKVKKTLRYSVICFLIIVATFYLSFLLDYQTGRINWLGF
ncbi:hypothetical protein D3C76_166230 [compost metagenome]